MPGVLWQWTLDSDYQSVTSTISVSVGNHCHQHTHYTDFIQTLYSDIHVYYTVTTTSQTRSEWSTEGLLWWVFLWPVIQSLLCEVFQCFTWSADLQCGGGVFIQFSDQFPPIMMSRLAFLHPSLAPTVEGRNWRVKLIRQFGLLLAAWSSLCNVNFMFNCDYQLYLKKIIKTSLRM